ncbi:CHAT domain-containing protein [Scytonema sp. NUACC26]|uniref:CHAT domain-containing protein n=1 Tax=Scytonema sp. NUACC26 TaxID=3140176 RepID=UPI0034DB9413
MARIWQRSLKFIFLVVVGLIFSLGVHILPADSRLTSNSKDFTIQAQTPTNTDQLVKQGKTLYQAGQFSQAAQSLKQAVEIYAFQGDILNQALSLNYLSLAMQKLGQWQQAKESITTSINLLSHFKFSTGNRINRVPTKHILALSLNTQGSLQLALGQTEAAIESWKQAANNYTQVNDEVGRIGSLINQAIAMQSLGLYLRANKIFDSVKESLQAQPSSLLKAAGLRSLGDTLRSLGDLNNSEKILYQSLAVAQEIQSPEEESATLLSLGNIAFAKGNNNLKLDNNKEDAHPLSLRCESKPLSDNATTYYSKAFKYYHTAANKSTSKIATVQAQLNRLSVLLALEQKPKAEELRSLQSQIASLTPSRAGVYARVNLAQSLVCLERVIDSEDRASKAGEIARVLNIAIQQAQELKDQRAESYAVGNLGQVYEYTKQFSMARQYTESALNLAQTINSLDIVYQWQWQLGRLLVQKGDSKGAIAAYSQSVESLKSLRNDLAALDTDIKFNFRDEVEPVYRQLVALLLQPPLASPYKGGDTGEVRVSQENLKQARSVIESLQLAELDNFFRNACLIAEPRQIDQIVDSADSSAAVIYPIVLAESLEVIVKLPRINALRHYRTYKPKSQIESTLEDLRQKLEEVYTFRDREALSKEVYNWLIEPVQADLQQSKVKTLVFVLDGSLRNIPMAALYDGKQYLIEKYSIALTPGLQLLSPKQEQRRLEALTAGLTEARLGYSPLPNVATELQQIKSVIPAKQLLNQGFTEKSIENQVSSVSFPVVHLATHGKFSSQQEDTFILAWNGKINVNQLREVLQTREPVVGQASRVPPPLELLVLSACETATGDKRATLGLAGVAVRSGARSTLASLWQVDDKSTALLMGEFYRQLTKNPTLTKAEALRRAQQVILQQYREHPFYWAPYVLVGNWL